MKVEKRREKKPREIKWLIPLPLLVDEIASALITVDGEEQLRADNVAEKTTDSEK